MGQSRALPFHRPIPLPVEGRIISSANNRRQFLYAEQGSRAGRSSLSSIDVKAVCIRPQHDLPYLFGYPYHVLILPAPALRAVGNRYFPAWDPCCSEVY